MRPHPAAMATVRRWTSTPDSPASVEDDFSSAPRDVPMSGLRFHPPPIRLSPETAWVLLRAFGPTDRTWTPAAGFSPDEAVARAGRLHLAPRIATRHARSPVGGAGSGLESEIGPGPAAALTAARRAAAARDAQLEACALEVRRIAATLGADLVLVKYAALRAVGAVAPGSRLAADVDVLVRREDVERLWRALLDHGFRPTGQPGWEHQLPGLAHPGLGEVELHVHLPGVGLDLTEDGRSATVETLVAAGALETLPAGEGPSAGSTVPARPVLLAHSLVHGLAQHGWAPASYPPFRSVSDWLDLELGTAGDGELLAAALPWLRGSVDEGEAEAAALLSRLLAEGRPEALEGSGAGALLGRHLLAGVLDPAYARSLGLHRVGPAPGAGAAPGTRTSGASSPPGRIARTLLHALLPNRAELATLYGPWRSPAGLVARRVVRPLDLVARSVLAGVARLRLLVLKGRPRTV